MNIDKSSHITPKQQNLIREYLKDYNEARALAAAGYSPSSKVFYNKAVRKFIQKKLHQSEEETPLSAAITKDWIIIQLKNIYNKCITPEKGRIDASGANRALELLGRYLGMWIDKMEMSLSIKEVQTYVVQIIDIVKDEVTDADTRNRIANRLETLGILEKSEEIGK